MNPMAKVSKKEERKKLMVRIMCMALAGIMILSAVMAAIMNEIF